MNLSQEVIDSFAKFDCGKEARKIDSKVLTRSKIVDTVLEFVVRVYFLFNHGRSFVSSNDKQQKGKGQSMREFQGDQANLWGLMTPYGTMTRSLTSSGLWKSHKADPFKKHENVGESIAYPESGVQFVQSVACELTQAFRSLCVPILMPEQSANNYFDTLGPVSN